MKDPEEECGRQGRSPGGRTVGPEGKAALQRTDPPEPLQLLPWLVWVTLPPPLRFHCTSVRGGRASCAMDQGDVVPVLWPLVSGAVYKGVAWQD